MQDGPVYNHLGYVQDCPVNSKKTLKCIICRTVLHITAYNHLGYMQDSNLTKPNPNLNPNFNRNSRTS